MINIAGLRDILVWVVLAMSQRATVMVPEWREIGASATVVLTGTFGTDVKSAHVRVVIEAASVAEGETCRCGLRKGLSEGGYRVVSRVADVKMTIDGQEVNVPLDVFFAMDNPARAALRSERDTMILSIEGGDGAYSYVVRVYFDKTHVTRRTWASGMAPDKLGEDSRYFPLVIE